jgi:hypothetical protein
MTKHVCDRCGEEIGRYVYDGSVLLGSKDGGAFMVPRLDMVDDRRKAFRIGRKAIDLCNVCAAALVKLIERFQKRPVQLGTVPGRGSKL